MIEEGLVSCKYKEAGLLCINFYTSNFFNLANTLAFKLKLDLANLILIKKPAVKFSETLACRNSGRLTIMRVSKFGKKNRLQT